MSNDIQWIMSPRSVAVVGASNRPGSVGNAVFRNILNSGFQGILYPVNPKAPAVHSVMTFPSLLDIPNEVDLAVVIVPAEAVLKVVEEAAAKKVKGMIVISAGFKETGGRGRELEEQLLALARANGIRLIGPNCLGVINTYYGVQLNASFATKMPKAGSIAFISQSGALCTAVLDFAAGENIGFSKFVSFGNKADVNEIDLLRYLKDDADTDVILMYLEDISNGREFIDTAREITWGAGKPILAIKSGRSVEGARAATSHTGSLAGSDLAYDAIFMQSGIMRVEGVNELFNYAIAFARAPLPRGNRIAIVTNAGGPGIMATDAAMRHGLALAEFSEDTRAALKQSLPPTASLHNPVDIIGDATHERYESALRSVLLDDGVDGVIVILTPQAMTDVLATAKIVPRVARDLEDKPILCSFMGIVDVDVGNRYLEDNGIPNYAFPEEAVRSMAAMVRFGGLLRLERRQVRLTDVDREGAGRLIKDALGSDDRRYLAQNEANPILARYGLPVLKSRLVRDAGELAAATAEVGFPVAMKIISPEIVHKFDAGGVRLKVKSLAEAAEAFAEIMANARSYNPQAKLEGVLMERMAQKGIEVILGATRDPKFGPILMFGLGGTMVEALKDVTFRVAPLWEVSAEIMIASIKAASVLRGFRGNPPSDVAAIKDCILRLSQLVSDHPEVSELDINPLIVYAQGQGAVVADSRILLARAK